MRGGTFRGGLIDQSWFKRFSLAPQKKLWRKCPQGTKGPWEMSKWKASLVGWSFQLGPTALPETNSKNTWKLMLGQLRSCLHLVGCTCFICFNLVWNDHDGQLVTGPVKHNHQSSIGWSFKVYSSVLIHYYELQYLVVYMSIELSITYRMCNYLLLYNFL